MKNVFLILQMVQIKRRINEGMIFNYELKITRAKFVIRNL